jgi:hypothetical protein
VEKLKCVTNDDDRAKLQRALDCLCEWEEKWSMSFNLAKCKIMHVGLHNPGFDYYKEWNIDEFY